MSKMHFNNQDITKQLKQLDKENGIFLDTLNTQNQSMKSFLELQENHNQLEKQKDNFQDAMFIILHSINELQNGDIDKASIDKILSQIGTAAINSIVNAPIKKHFENEVLKGSLIAQNLANQYYNSIESMKNENISQMIFKVAFG